MPVRKDKHGRWRYRTMVRLPDGRKERISGTPELNTKAAALEEERLHIQRTKNPTVLKPAAPKFGEFFNGRFWQEWVIARKNKPGEMEEKKRVFERYLRPRFASKPLDGIRDDDVLRLQAELSKCGLKEKTVNNIVTVLSKPLNYAVDVGLIERAPKVRLYKVEAPEISCWEIEEYSSILAAALIEGAEWHRAVMLAGEAGLRVGEVRALQWQRDIDLVGGTITVNEQSRHGVTDLPKGRRRRKVPMTDALKAALAKASRKTGFVVANPDGSQVTDGQTSKAIYRIYERAAVPERRGAWHLLRHTFGTHSAMFGVNAWTLMMWLGHRRIEETMLYVNLDRDHARPMPAEVRTAGEGEVDPERRIIKMLGARGNVVAKGKEVD